MRSLTLSIAFFAIAYFSLIGPVQVAKAQDGSPDPSAKFTEGQRLLLAGKFEEAIESYLQALDETPANYYLWLDLGEAYRSTLRMPDAIAAFRKTLDLSRKLR